MLGAPPARLPWIQARLAELTVMLSYGGYALLMGEPPGSAAVVPFEPM